MAGMAGPARAAGLAHPAGQALPALPAGTALSAYHAHPDGPAFLASQACLVDGKGRPECKIKLVLDLNTRRAK